MAVETENELLRRTLRAVADSAPPVTFETLLRLAADAGRSALVEDINLARNLAGQMAHQWTREAEQNALLETARGIARLRDTDGLLRAIAQRARQIATSDLAYISSIEDDAEQFVVRATEGCISKDFEAMRVPRKHGMCGQVLSTRRPCITLNYLLDRSFTRHSRIDAIVHEEGIVSMLGVPLEIDGRVIGVLFVGQRAAHHFSPRSIAVLTSLAALAAVAIQSSRLFEETQRAFARERAVNNALNERAAELQAAGQAHEQMIDLLVHDRSLEDLVGRLSQILKCRAALVDSGLRVLVIAEDCSLGQVLGALDADVPPWRPSLSDAVRESTVSGRSAMHQATDKVVCRVAPILGGRIRLGTLAIWRPEDLSEAEIRTLERGSVLAAIMLLADERRHEATQRNVHETLSALLQTRSGPLAFQATRRQLRGDPLSYPLTLYLVELGSLQASLVAAAVKSVVNRNGVIAAEYQGDFVVLAGPDANEEFGQLLKAVIERETQHRVNVAVSARAKDAHEVADRYSNARWTLQMLRRLGCQGQIGHEDLFAIYSPLFRDKGGDEIEAFVQSAIGPLKTYDESHRANLIKTLLVFVDVGQKLQSAANNLDVHVNTVRQRLATIRAVCPRWDRPERLLETHLALRLHQLGRNSL